MAPAGYPLSSPTMTKKRPGLARIFAIHFGPFGPPHFVGSSHWRVSLVVAVKGRTDGVCSPCGAGGAIWMPDTPGFVMPWKLNFQQTWDGVIVMVAVPARKRLARPSTCGL